jgi:hypothetical protein
VSSRIAWTTERPYSKKWVEKIKRKRRRRRKRRKRRKNALNKERILKAVREKGQVTYKGRPIRITPDFSPETMKVRRSGACVIQTEREHKCQPSRLYQAKLLITIDRENKIVHDKTKFIQYHLINPALQMIIDRKHQHKEGNQVLEKQESNLSANPQKDTQR